MSEPFIGEIRMVGFDFPPKGWALCDGQLLPINQHEALFALLGTYYGGNGQTHFALPDLRGRSAVHQGTAPGLSPRGVGQEGGVEEVALTKAQLPPHSHSQPAAGASSSNKPVGRAPAVGGKYADPADKAMAPTGAAGGGQPHENMAPFLVVSFIIALEGIFPSQV